MPRNAHPSRLPASQKRAAQGTEEIFINNLSTQLSSQITLIVVPLLAIALIFVASPFVEYRDVLWILGVPAQESLFVDLRQTIEFANNSANEITPPDSYGRLGFAWAPFTLIPLDHVIATGTLVALAYILICSRIFSRSPNPLFGVFLVVSYASFFAMERGQPDIILFLLVFSAVRLAPRYRVASMFVGLYAALLKFFPVSLALMYWDKNPRRSLVSSGVFVVLFGTYFVWDFAYITSMLQQQTVLYEGITRKSFGSQGIFNLLNETRLFTNNDTVLDSDTLGLAASIFIALGFMLLGHARRLTHRIEANEESFLLFIAGSAIYLTTFAASRNFDYKVIFLIFCVPLLQTIFSQRAGLRGIASILLLAILFYFHNGSFDSTFIDSIAKKHKFNELGQVITLYLVFIRYFIEFVSWLIFAGLCYVLSLVLPNWVHEGIDTAFARMKTRLLSMPRNG